MSLMTFNTVIMSKIYIIGSSIDYGTRAHWDVPSQSLYYVDVPNSQIFKYIPSLNQTTQATVGTRPLGFAFPIENTQNQFIAASGRQLILFNWDDKTENVSNIEAIGEVDKDKPTNRLNGGKVDPLGRLWAGTMGPTDENGDTIPEMGALYMLTNGIITKQEENIGISSGLAWNADLGKMYYTDTLFPEVYQYDYNVDTGDISNKTVIFKLRDHKILGSPSGLTIDINGNLWAAIIFGSKVICFNPTTSKLVKTINMPTSQITDVTFGGENMNDLFINTAKMSTNKTLPEYPAGCTFVIENVNVKGLPGDKYVMDYNISNKIDGDYNKTGNDNNIDNNNNTAHNNSDGNESSSNNEYFINLTN